MIFKLITLIILVTPLGMTAQTGQPNDPNNQSQQKNQGNLKPPLYRFDIIKKMPIVILFPVSDKSGDVTQDQSNDQSPKSSGDQSNGEDAITVGNVTDLIASGNKISHILADLNDTSGRKLLSGAGSYLLPVQSLSIRENQATKQPEMVLTLQSIQNKEVIRAKDDNAIKKVVPKGVKITQLKNCKVVDIGSGNIGSIEDFVINNSSHSIEYAAVSAGGFIGIGNKLIAIPFNDIQFNVEQSQAKITVAKSQFESLKSFDSNNWPPKADPNWRKQLATIPPQTRSPSASGSQNQNPMATITAIQTPGTTSAPDTDTNTEGTDDNNQSE